ncbi:Protein of unknown function DUF1501 [Burkholderiales bacterium]
MNRRYFLGASAGLAGLTGLGLLAGASRASASGYRSVVAIHLAGGMDGNDLLVPTDSAYSGYASARGGLALPKAQLVPFAKPQFGHTLGLNPAASALMPLFESEKLSFLVNVGALAQPTAVAEVLNRTAVLPPFLGSHPESAQIVSGWGGDVDATGWGGRLADVLALKPEQRPIVQVAGRGGGKQARLLQANLGAPFEFNVNNQPRVASTTYTNGDDPNVRMLERLFMRQGASPVLNEAHVAYQKLALDIAEITRFLEADIQVPGDFGTTEIGKQMRAVAQLQVYFKNRGLGRQVFHIEWGQFDTHDNQRPTDQSDSALDPQLQDLSRALAAYQKAVDGLGLAQEVVVLVASEFGRTLDVAGSGTDHAWGNHWMLMGEPIRGGQMVGQSFPLPLLGGPDDGDRGKRGYWVPQLSSDVVVADLARFMGVPESKMLEVAPRLAKFPVKTANLLG